MPGLTKLITCCLALTLSFGLSTSAESLSDEGSASGSFWFESRGADGEVTTLDLEIVDGIAIRDELMGGQRVNVVLVGQPIDREAFLQDLAKTRNLRFTLSRMGMDGKVGFDVCANEDGAEVQVCGIYFSGHGVSNSSSGFGVYEKYVESVSFSGDRVSAKLRTTSDDKRGELTWRFALEFDLPILEKESK